jgi:hypothetical protein
MNEVDRRARLATEGFARLIDRRAFLRRSLRAGFAALAATALGTFQPAKMLANADCSCSFPFTRDCASIGIGQYHCPATTAGGCPSGCKVCTTASSCSPCVYSAGHWSSCGCGVGGAGCRECYDCICPSSTSCNSGACGCRGTCRCCNCLTPQDVVEELARIDAASSRAA